MLTADKALATLNACIRRNAEQPTYFVNPRTTPVKGAVTTLVCSDMHAPFHNPDAIAEAICHGKTAGATRAILLGDIDDGYEFSVFSKDQRIPFMESLSASAAIIEVFAANFGEVVLVEGNHDAPRFTKMLSRSLPTDAIEAIKFLSKGNLNYIEAISRQFPNVRYSGHRVEDIGMLGWMSQIGDALFLHAEKFSNATGTAIEHCAQWILQRQSRLGLKPWRVLFQGHTHQLNMISHWDEKILIETGCLCNEMRYQYDPKLRGKKPQRLGYTIFTQKNGVTIPSSIRPVLI